ncbi:MULTISPECIES: hypothetical protein [unclassified Roseateles]|uniref:hypothetical protein n=1 Tax=unclassified Roseateles TaxID=2626991 RepID=UPI0007161C17|nr:MULTISPECIES: hypothetical protein [unclassified Roseateles]KRA67629.1 hypothetical protein ASD88_23805 [Pelomonas sp. Root662]
MADLIDAQLLLYLVDLVLAVSLIELLWLCLRRPTGLANLAPNLLAGLSLTLALRLSLVGSASALIVLCLTAAGLSHLLDLLARRRHPDVFSAIPPTGQGKPTP